MASAEASSVVDVANELLDAHVLQMQLDGAWHFPAVFSGVEFDLASGLSLRLGKSSGG